MTPNPESDRIKPDQREGWNAPKPDRLTKPTWWPAALAFGITLTAWGLIASFIVAAVGAMAVCVSLAGWIIDICHERKKS